MAFAELTKELQVLSEDFSTDILRFQIKEIKDHEVLYDSVQLVAIDRRDGLPYEAETVVTLEEGKNFLSQWNQEYGEP